MITAYPFLLFCIFMTAALAGAILIARGRTPLDVLDDLEDPVRKIDRTAASLPHAERQKGRELAQAGFFTPEEQRCFLQGQVLIVGLVACAFALSCLLSAEPLLLLIPSLVPGVALGYLIARYRLRRATRSYRRKVEFSLPLAMEHLVMAAESGLDIIPAIGALLDLQHRQERHDYSQRDPVTRLFATVYALSQAGVPFERALQEVSAQQECAAVRHAFVHLGLAHKEGGELIGPLRELSNASQLYYQETVEEEIAKMPVRATLPLVLTFAGLILFFITAPIVQILSIAENAAISGNGENVNGGR